MYICRLFHRDRPFEQVDARLIADGRVGIGRDPSADWPLHDPDATLSRLHCVLSVEGGRLLLYDKSTNGVFLRDGARAPQDAPLELKAGESFWLGTLSILVEQVDDAEMDAAATTLLTPSWSGPTPVASEWAEGPGASAHRDASLIEAFCQGARLDASALSSEDPAELMQRVGAIYRQTVLGLAALMADREQVKRTHQLKSTTISARDNNPFKWAPSRKLAEDLLCGREAAFLADAAAVRASFADLSRHMAGLVGGAQAAVDRVTSELDPAGIDTEARANASLLRGRAAVALDMLTKRHARLSGGSGAPDATLQGAFGQGYERASNAVEAA